jgi:methyl-accepting chemotaxis protein
MLGSCITLVLLTVLGIVCYTSIQTLENANHWVDHTHNVVKEAMKIEAAAVDMETGMRGFLLSGRNGFLDPYKGGKERFYKLISGLKQTVNDNPAQVELLTDTHDNISGWIKNVTEPAISFRREVGQTKTMEDIAKLVAEARGKTYFDKFRGQIKKFRDREMALMDGRKKTAKTTAAFTNKAIIGGIAVSIAISLLVSFLLTNSITAPFKRIFQGLKSFSTNELDTVRRRFEEVINNLNQTGNRVASASTEIAAGATQQASSIEETASSLEEMSGMVENNVTNARKGVDLSNEVKDSSSKGNEAMQNLQQSMGEILKSNEQIENLVKVIGNIGEKTQVMDEIVFQTKLLSFNASVEAERAGEHGRGFAVVAQEVGNLAQMSGKAAQEIAEIVKDSIKSADKITNENKSKVESGNTFVKDAASILKSIMESSVTVTDGSKQVLTASEDQSNGIKQINKAMSELDKVTQTNAGLTDDLSSQADGMKEALDVLIEIVRGSKENSPQPQTTNKAENKQVVHLSKYQETKNQVPHAVPQQEVKRAVNDDGWEKL